MKDFELLGSPRAGGSYRLRLSLMMAYSWLSSQRRNLEVEILVHRVGKLIEKN